jgi:type I restriction enzyme S subunit
MRDNWKEISLVDLALFRRGSFPQPYGLDKWYDDNNGMPFIQVYDVDDNMKLKRVTKRKISKLGAQMSVFIPKGSLILTIQGSIGRVAITDYDAYMDRTLLVFQKFYEEVDLRFIMYIIKELFNIAKENANGSTIKTITKEELSDYTINLPPLPQQQKIANILSTCDTVIEKTESAIAKYQAIKQGLMHDLFTRGIDVNTGQLRPTPEDAPELYKESALGLIPREWETDELINLTKLVTDGAHFSPVPQEKGLPIGNVKDMRDSNFDYDKCTKILPEVFKLLVRQNCSPLKGDVLLSKDGTIGKVIHFEDDREIVLLSSIAIIRVNELLDSRYLSWALESEYFDKALYALLSGSALKRITLKDILKIRLPFSKDLIEQKLIASRLQKTKDKIQTEQQALAKYQQLKAGLMQDLLTGRVEVSV